MKFWQAMQKISEEQAIRFKKANYYLIIKDNVLVAYCMDDNLPINCMNTLSFYGLEEDGWELYQVTHDFAWAKEQMQRGNIVRRTSWPINDKYIAKDNCGVIRRFYIGPGFSSGYALTMDDLNATDWIRYNG